MRVELQDGDWYDLPHSGQYDDDGREMFAGLLFEGSRGQYIYGAIVQLAVDHGFRLSPGAERNIQLARAESVLGDVAATEKVVELADRAEEYLNDQVAPDGWAFGWCDGEYFLANEAWWEFDA